MTPVDVIGDVHGQLGPLRRLGRALGYQVEHGWSHPDGRVPVFLGDLIDRGPHSLGVVREVRGLVEADRAVCLMGNHEYNLLAWLDGKRTRAGDESSRAVRDDPETWRAELNFLASLPLAIELPGLRMVHACWHRRCFDQVRRHLGREARGATAGVEWIRDHVVLGSPFGIDGRLVEQSAWGVDKSHERCHEVLIKGLETRPAQPIIDADGKPRDLARVPWWTGEHPDVATEIPTVFGHYWSVPPRGADGPFAPVGLLAGPENKAWLAEAAHGASRRGTVALPEHVAHVCVDFQGVAKAGGAPTVGALRWPERQVAWCS